MSNLPAVIPLTEADYELIEGAVMETVRGRWFLAEYARRNRQADTSILLAAINRLQTAIDGRRTVGTIDRIRLDLTEMSHAIARAKAEIVLLQPDPEDHRPLGGQPEPSASIIQSTEAAVAKVLTAAEQVEDIVWTLREQGLEAQLCDVLDSKASEIYAACADQELIVQRTGKLIELLRALEGRIDALIDLLDVSGEDPERSGSATQSGGPDRHPGPDHYQSDLEQPRQASASTTVANLDDAALERPSPQPTPSPSYGVSGQPSAADHGAQPAPEPLAPRHHADSGTAATDARTETLRPSLSLSSGVLGRIEALSPEEKIALFS
jgi:hypothetical protein